LLAFAAPFVVDRARRPIAWLALALIAATLLIYFIYVPFDDWSYLRFLLPAITLMLALSSAVVVRAAWGAAERSLGSVFRRIAAPATVCALTIGLGVFGIRTAKARFAFTLHALEQRYRSAGSVVREQLPSNAVVLSGWDSGAVRFHGRKEALVWEGLDPAWLDRSVDWLDSHGHRPYILVESWEESGFRSRFGNQSGLGKLDWPPKYEIDRIVRIYDPADRAKYGRGERVSTQYVWPFRK
jgi:hypothetical protein